MDNWLEKLKGGLLIINIKGDIRQPHNHAMDRVPDRFSRWSIASQYLYDIERILQEMKSAVSFISILPENAFLQKHSITSEDYIMYHQGYFLDLVHQLKNKLFQFISAIMTPDSDYSEKNEKRAEKINKVMDNKFVKHVPGLAEYLREWNADNSKGVIAVALKKRTNYHHFKNPLSNTKSYVRAKTNRSLLSPDFQVHLSEHGRHMIAEKGVQNLQMWQGDTVERMSKTFDAINENMQNISRITMGYLRLPTKDSRIGNHVLLRYVRLFDSLETKNSSYTLESVNPAFRGLIPILEEALTIGLQDEFLSFYVTGSILNGNFNFGLSDINLVIVVKHNTVELREIIHNFIDTPPRVFGIPTDTKILSEQEFFDQSSEKLRFICKTDGLLVSGVDLLRNESGQSISFKLAWMLNSDFKDHVYLAKERLLDTSHIMSDRDRELLARDLAKRAYRLSFSMVIGNNVRYAADFKKMRELNNYYYPENKRSNDIYYKMINNRLIIDEEGVLALIENLEGNLFPLYDAIDKVVNAVPDKKH